MHVIVTATFSDGSSQVIYDNTFHGFGSVISASGGTSKEYWVAMIKLDDWNHNNKYPYAPILIMTEIDNDDPNPSQRFFARNWTLPKNC